MIASHKRSSTPVSAAGMIRAGGSGVGGAAVGVNGSPASQKRQSFPPTAAVSPYPPPGYAAVAAADGTASTTGFNAGAMPPQAAPVSTDHAKYQLFNVMIKKNPGLGFSIAGQ